MAVPRQRGDSSVVAAHRSHSCALFHIPDFDFARIVTDGEV